MTIQEVQEELRNFFERENGVSRSSRKNAVHSARASGAGCTRTSCLPIPYREVKTGSSPAEVRNSSQMYAGNWCPHHAHSTHLVGRPGTVDERPQCDECEAEFQRALARLAS